MEQTNQQSIQKASFPIKTKIAAWLIIVMGGISIITVAYLFQSFSTYFPHSFLEGIFPFFKITIPISLLLFLLPGFFLLKRKKWAWWYAMVILLIFATCLVPSSVTAFFSYYNLESAFFPIISFLLIFFTLILLILDRKNFFKIQTSSIRGSQ